MIQGSPPKNPGKRSVTAGTGEAGRHTESSALCYPAGRRLSSMSCRDSSFSPSTFAAFPPPSYVRGSSLAGGRRGPGGPRPPLLGSRAPPRPAGEPREQPALLGARCQALRPVSAAGLVPNTRRGLSARGGEGPSRGVAGAGRQKYISIPPSSEST